MNSEDVPNRKGEGDGFRNNHMLTGNLVSEVDGQFLIYFTQVGLELLHCYNYVVCISKLVFTDQRLLHLKLVIIVVCL